MTCSTTGCGYFWFMIDFSCHLSNKLFATGWNPVGSYFIPSVLCDWNNFHGNAAFHSFKMKRFSSFALNGTFQELVSINKKLGMSRLQVLGRLGTNLMTVSIMKRSAQKRLYWNGIDHDRQLIGGGRKNPGWADHCRCKEKFLKNLRFPFLRGIVNWKQIVHHSWK